MICSPDPACEVIVEYDWTCACCGKTFDTLPLDFGCRYPDHWFSVPEDERSARCRSNADFCEVDGHYFVRGVVEVPILGLNDTFGWGVWVSLSEASFDRFLALWDQDVPADEPPRFGWLANWLPGYPSPDDIKCEVSLRPDGLRPAILLEPTDYPLAIEQHRGITLARVQEIVASFDRHGRGR